MKNQRNNFTPQLMPFMGPNTMPTNMMMFPNYMNDNYNNLENKINTLEKKVKVLENKVARLENPYQNNMNYQQNQNNFDNQNLPYETTQNNGNYNGEMYMM